MCRTGEEGGGQQVEERHEARYGGRQAGKGSIGEVAGRSLLQSSQEAE